MDFSFFCPKCSRELIATDDHVGYEIECPSCFSTIIVPNIENTLKSNILTTKTKGYLWIIMTSLIAIVVFTLLFYATTRLKTKYIFSSPPKQLIDKHPSTPLSKSSLTKDTVSSILSTNTSNPPINSSATQEDEYEPAFPKELGLNNPSYVNLLSQFIDEHYRILYHDSGTTGDSQYPFYNVDFTFNHSDYRIRTFHCNIPYLQMYLLYKKEHNNWNCIFATFSHAYRSQHRIQYQMQPLHSNYLGAHALRMINHNEDNQQVYDAEWQYTCGNVSGSPLWVSLFDSTAEYVYAARLNKRDLSNPNKSIDYGLKIYNYGISQSLNNASNTNNSVPDINMIYEFK